ncbi:gem-associated protein 5, partial [Asbolus verrucosus]
MNELIIPHAPLWYRSSVMACSPDNILVYGSQNDIVIVRDKDSEEPAEIKIIQGAHSKNVTSVSLNKKWKDPHSFIVSLGEENMIKVWDFESYERIFSNKEHMEHKQPVVGAVFAGDDRVVSAAANGVIIIWNIIANESKVLKDLFNSKVTLTCLSSCPHAAWLLAFGLNNGCVIVADLRRNGQILYKLRGHYQAVVSLSWCPAPVNVFPRYTQNTVKNKSEETAENKNVEPKLAEQSAEKHEKRNPWINLVHADDDEVALEKQESVLTESVSDFLKECDDLKSKILGVVTSIAISNTTEENEEKQANTELKQQYEEKGIEEAEGTTESVQKLNEDRPLPQLFDPSGDFLDNFLPVEEEIFEDKDVGNEKNRAKNILTDKADTSEDGEDKIDILASEENKIDVLASGDSGVVVEDYVSVKTEVIEEEPRTEYLLASSGKDRSVYIWRAGTDGRMQTFFHTPKKSKNRDHKNTNVWITVCWIAPDTILTSSMTGEVLAWPLPKPKESSKQYRIVHNEHASVIFNVVTPPKYLSPCSWRNKTDLTAWSWGQDGRLINYDLNAQKVRLSYSTVTASVTCFDCSALDPNRLVDYKFRLAIGVRDGSIRVWDLSLPHVKTIAMNKYHQKFTHKVTTIAWNPVKEMILGFGTEEGRVGFIDMASKKSTLFPHYFHNQVYKIEWGPLQGDTNNLGLYVVAEGKIAIYDTREPNSDPVELELPQQLYVYRFAWKPDFSLLLLNGKDGSLVVLRTDLVALTTIYLNDKGLNGIVWHPDAFTNKTEISARCNWFAATTSRGLLVYDCVLFNEETATSENFMEKIVVVLEGHLRPPLSLAWCPFDGNKIVSTAADGLALVWDVVSKSTIATFVDPYLYHNPAVIWSPIDSDLIIMGDKVIRVWSVSKNPPRIDEEFMSARKRLLSKTSKIESDKTDNKIKVDIPQIKNDQQKREGKYKSCELISLWKGNISEYIEDAINENRVTPTIISVAPMVSSKLWHDACIVYAKKLSENANSDPLETAMYFLACHKVEEAINCLCLSFMFKEALALAKHRLPNNSEIITTVTVKWADYISIRQYLNAAKVLARRNNKEFLEFAAELADKEGNKGLYDSIKFKCNEIQSDQSSSRNNDSEKVEDNLPSRIDAIFEVITGNGEKSSENHSETEDEDKGEVDEDDQHLVLNGESSVDVLLQDPESEE